MFVSCFELLRGNRCQGGLALLAGAGPLLLACRQVDVLLRARRAARRPAKARGREVHRV